MSQNLTEQRGKTLTDADYTETGGAYITFQKGDHLDKTKSQCLTDDLFPTKDGQSCIADPANCEEGLSFSIFYSPEYTESSEDLLNKSRVYEREYIMSTGGESGIPGVAIYRRGANLGAVVSMGNLTWDLEVDGSLPPKNHYTNIAVRWEKPKVNTQAELDAAVAAGMKNVDIGGLELFLNMKPYGRQIFPHIHGCTYEKSTAMYTCQDPLPPVTEPFGPPEMNIGCHRTKANPTPRLFSSGKFDELAMWKKQLNDTELYLFMGGYQETLSDMSADQLLSLMVNVDMKEVAQAQAVFGVVANIVDGGSSGDDTPYKNIYPEDSSGAGSSTTESSTDASGDNSTEQPAEATQTQTTAASAKKELLTLLEVVNKMVDVTKLQPILSVQEVDIRLEGAAVTGDILSTKSRFARPWADLLADPNFEGAHKTRDRYLDFLTYLTERRTVVGARNDENEVNKIISTSNQGSQVMKRRAQNYRALGNKEEYWTFPDWKSDGWKLAYNNWGMLLPPQDSIDVPSVVMTGDCESKEVTFVGVINDHFPGSGLKNPVFIRANRIELDSRVMSVDITANLLDQEKTSDTFLQFTERCHADPKMLIRKPLRVKFEVLSSRHSDGYGRKLLGYFDDLEKTKVRARHCVVYDPQIGVHGAWTTEGVKTISVDEAVATCYATRLGTFAVVAEIEDDPYREEEADWLTIFKMVGYVLSIICLLVFIGTIVTSTYLWEMFHTLGLHTAGCLLLGLVAMMLSELSGVRDDRDACAAVGCFINFFFVAVASLMAMESYAVFKAITSGVIGGRTMVYLCYGYGLPFLALGYNVLQNLHLMGTDPNCMVAWPADPKWAFFGPVAALAAASLVLMLIVICNMSTPAMRKESIVEEMGSIAKGMVLLVFLFALTWSFAPLAYIEFPGTEMPDFYPAFQVLNSFSGVYIFVFIGLGSTRFRTVLAGKVMDRQQQLTEAEKDADHDATDNNVDEFAEDDTVTDSIAEEEDGEEDMVDPNNPDTKSTNDEELVV